MQTGEDLLNPSLELMLSTTMEPLIPGTDASLEAIDNIGIFHSTSMVLGPNEIPSMTNDEFCVPDPAYSPGLDLTGGQGVATGHLYDASPAEPKTACYASSAASSPCASEPTELHAEDIGPCSLNREDLNTLKLLVENQLLHNTESDNAQQPMVKTEGNSGDFSHMSVHIKPEPHDYGYEPGSCSKLTTPSFNASSEPKGKRKGGRPRDPVIYEPGMSHTSIMKKERRKEQNRRAARRCREKKKAQIDDIVQNYDQYKFENDRLKNELAHVKNQMERLKTAWKKHQSQCPLINDGPAMYHSCL